MPKTNNIPTYARVFNLNNINNDSLQSLMSTLLCSKQWHEFMERRNKFCKMFTQLKPGTAEANGAFKQIKSLDEKGAMMMFSFFVDMSLQTGNRLNQRSITLGQYVEEFIKNEEQQALYDDFHHKLQMANFLIDMAEGIINDANETLHKLDPTVILSEFGSIKQISTILAEYNYIHHKNEHPELIDCFAKWSDDISDDIYLKASMYLKERDIIRARLEAKGELKPDSITPQSPLY